MTRFLRVAMAKKKVTPVALFLVVALSLAACSSSPDVADAPESTTSTNLEASPNQDVLDAYRAYWAAYLNAADPMNPEDPALAEHSTGDQLAQVRSSFLARRSAGQVFRGNVEFAPKVLDRNGERATIEDCYLDQGQVFDANSGASLTPVDTQRQLVEVTMQFEAGKWKVAATTSKGEGCIAP